MSDPQRASVVRREVWSEKGMHGSIDSWMKSHGRSDMFNGIGKAEIYITKHFT
jgi:hypothetical protein